MANLLWSALCEPWQRESVDQEGRLWVSRDTLILQMGISSLPDDHWLYSVESTALALATLGSETSWHSVKTEGRSLWSASIWQQTRLVYWVDRMGIGENTQRQWAAISQSSCELRIHLVQWIQNWLRSSVTAVCFRTGLSIQGSRTEPTSLWFSSLSCWPFLSSELALNLLWIYSIFTDLYWRFFNENSACLHKQHAESVSMSLIHSIQK